MESMELGRVEQRTLTDEAAERLRVAIRKGVLKPGERLVERDLATRLGMSRIPVREAIQRLVEEGVVVKTPHRSTIVYVPTLQEIEEISSLRVVLERFVMERVIANWLPEHEGQLRLIVDHMQQAAAHQDLVQVYEQDYLFHNTLWEIANHNLLLEVVSSLRSRINRFLYEANSSLPASQMEHHIASHDHLVTVIASGNVADAQEEITTHILGGKTRVIAYCNLQATSMSNSM